MADDNGQLEREVKEFGNGAHVTIPRDYIGETVVIKPISDSESVLQPPITKDKIKAALLQTTREDFSFRTREDDDFPREGEFQLESDVRLSIDVDLVYEAGGPQITNSVEAGRVVHILVEPTHEELVEHADWWSDEDAGQVIGKKEDGTPITTSPPETVLSIDPAAADILDHAGVGYGDLYRYSVRWNGSEIASVMFANRTASEGRLYLPVWEEYDSLEDYRSSIAYALATAISSAPVEDYDQYLEMMTDRGIGWSSGRNREDTLDLTREELLEETILCRP